MSEKKIYDKDWETLIYNQCEERGYFEPDGNKKLQDMYKKKYVNERHDNTFCIMMPPPNVTGVLHIGHALTFTLQDIITRYMRMNGYETLWQPGLDHAGIATQNVVEKQLLAKGITKEQIGREAFIKKIWEWKEESGGEILKQMRLMGFSPAFKRTRFTMDMGLANAVKATFKSWYDRGFIYRGNRMINWCTKDGALSDIEVEYEENKGKLYYLRYFLIDNQTSTTNSISPSSNFHTTNNTATNYIVVATTRPETYFGDTAIMVNPQDSRYKHIIGKKVQVPLIERTIEIIADSGVDMEFGTGAVKVTPAHDMNDYEVAQRHNLDSIVVFDKHGILNEQCGRFCGQERLNAREAIIATLQDNGFVEKIEEYHNKIGKCYRCGNIIEPYISKQWFVKSSIAKGAIERVAKGETTFYPMQWKNNYNAWMRDLKDWCISRQLWWGHRIPVFYCACGHEFVSLESHTGTISPQESIISSDICTQSLRCPKCHGTDIRQDEDVLDTWFSSALWSHSTLGFMNGDFGKGTLWQEHDLTKFHPNSLLITGFDILFFWVARMLISADTNMNAIAFKDIYLHALVLDEKGQKMSKSKGNVINPLDLCKEYGADVVRFTLAFLCIQGRDIRMSHKQLEITRNFTNKLINAMSFLQLYAKQLRENGYSEHGFYNKDSLQEYNTPLGIYMKSRLNFIISEVKTALNAYRFDMYANIMYKFLWNEFCDIGIEFTKVSKHSVFELGSIFLESMKLLHPLMPFLSEYLYHTLLGRDITHGLGNFDSIMIESFPTDTQRNLIFERAFAIISDSITTIRRMKINLEIGNSEIEKVYIELNSTYQDIVESANCNHDFFASFICKLGKVKNIVFVDSKPQKTLADIGECVKIYIQSSSFDIQGLKNRIDKQAEKTHKEIMKLESMLNNKKFIAHAPQDIVETNRQNLKELKEKYQKIQDEKNNLQNL